MDKEALVAIFRAAVAALDPADLVEAALRRRRLDRWTGDVAILALGKAAAGMVRGADRVFGERASGVAVTPEPAELPGGFVGLVGSHPVPDERSVSAGRALLAQAAAIPSQSLVICLISGGGSALAEVPVPGITIGQIARVTEELLASGAAIDEINAVRRALSALKGGGLAAAVQSRRLVTLAISDVGGAPPETIASGPTVAVSRDLPAVREVLRRYGLAEAVTASALESSGPSGQSRSGGDFEVIADGATGAAAAVAAAAELGLSAAVARRLLSGEARREAQRVIAAGTGGSDLMVHWGETTVTVTGTGEGGRNHEAALAAAIAIEGRRGAFLAGGTDGIDGSTRAAGAVVDGASAAAARSGGLDPATYLAANDSGGFFAEVPGQIITGPTGTNVADLWLNSVSAGSGVN